MSFRLSLAWALFALALLARPAAAQIPLYSQNGVEAQLRLGGQFRVSALHDDATGADRVGFGIRRSRAQLFVDVGERFSSFVQVEGTADIILVDALAAYAVAPRVTVQAGRFFGAQPVAFALTPFFVLDAVDRPAISRLWAARTIGADGRDFGVEAIYASNDVEARLFVHNGDGSWSRARGNVRDEVGLGDPTRGADTAGLALSGAASWRPSAVPGLDVGGFVGVNGSQNPNTAAVEGGAGRTYRTASAHAYWGRFPGSQPVRLKADAIVVDYDANGAGAPEQAWGGVSVLGAIRPAAGVEVFAQAERYVPDLDATDAGVTLASVGASVSLSAMRGGSFETVRLTGGWTTRFGDDDGLGPGADGVIVQGQLMF